MESIHCNTRVPYVVTSGFKCWVLALAIELERLEGTFTSKNGKSRWISELESKRPVNSVPEVHAFRH